MTLRSRPLGRTAGSPPSTHAWFPVMWHCMFVLLVTIGMVRAIGSDTHWSGITIIVVLSVTLMVWYGAPLARLSPWRDRIRVRTWLAVAGLLTLALMGFSTDFVWIIFPVTFQIFYRLGVLAAIAASGALTVAGIGVLAVSQGALDLAGTLGPLIGVTTAAVTAVGYRTVRAESEERAKLINRLQAAQQQVADAERAAGVAEERARLGREIHDTLAQGLASSLLLVEVAGNELDGNPGQARTHLDQAAGTLRGNIEEARRFVRDLSPATLAGASLHDALRGQGQQLEEATGAKVQFLVAGDPYPLGAPHEVALFRAAQEAMTNIRRHAQASTVHITLSYLDAAVTLDVVDDGVGMDPGTQPEGYGLQGMRERAEQLGGHVEIEHGPHGGAAVAIRLPVTNGEYEP